MLLAITIRDAKLHKMVSLCSQSMLKCIKYTATTAAELHFPTSPAAVFHAALYVWTEDYGLKEIRLFQYN